MIGIGTRREFLRRACLMSAILLASAGGPLSASPAARAVPRRARGSLRIDVRSMGARGDGEHDDTTAFQKAIDALPAEGGTVYVPAGTYAIDAKRSVRLRSRMHLQLAPRARLVARRNALERAYVLNAHRVSDVEISGGQIVGDRDMHLGTTGEWGHGIMIRGSARVTVRDIRISRCWGDGISIGGEAAKGSAVISSEDVVIARVVCTGNRRQGLTIGRSRKVRVHDSEFSNTSGTNPQSGIDIEPDAPGSTQDVQIENCLVLGNRGPGIQIYHRVSGVSIKRCTIERNGGHGVLAVSASDGLIADNRIRGNGLAGIGLQKRTSDFQILGNQFDNNAVRLSRTAFARLQARMGPASGRSERVHIDVAKDARAIRVAANRFGGK